jgi:hypothetical protein
MENENVTFEDLFLEFCRLEQAEREAGPEELIPIMQAKKSVKYAMMEKEKKNKK